MQRIIFRKKSLGRWRRDDGEARTFVNEEAMFREIQKLIIDGWEITPHGIIAPGNRYHARSYELKKN